ncbi:MAG: AAA family ATPase [Firmicutes bacterium]|nr:AAA family ATPase [Bacillota bacterium]
MQAICNALNIEPKHLFLCEEPASHQHPEGEGLTLQAFAKAKHLEAELLRQAQVTQGMYQGKPAVLLKYRDAEGDLQAIRYRVTLAGDRFRWQKGAEPRQLAYGEWWLPQWREKGRREIVLVEGESDALTLWQMGVPALGIAGANSLSEYHAELLAGFKVVVWQEPDSGGATFAQKASQLFQNVRLIEPPQGVKDANELWLKCVAQHGENAKAIFKQQIRELLAQAKPVEASEPQTLHETLQYIRGCKLQGVNHLYTLHELKNAPAHESSTEASLPFFGVSGIIRKGRSHLLAGKPRVGKTEALFRGGVLEWHNERILYLSEEGIEDWRVRLASFADDELPEQCHVRLCAGESRENLLAEIREGGYSVVVLDTLRGVWRLSDELHPSRVIQDVSPLIDLQRKLRFTLVVLHHERKAEGEAFSDRFAGTNALSGMFDMLLSLNQKSEGNLVLSYEGRTSQGGSLMLQWQDGNLRYVGEAETMEWRVLLQRIEAVLYRASKPLNTQEVRRELGEPLPGYRTVLNALNYLYQNQQIEREPKETKAGATYRWYITPTRRESHKATPESVAIPHLAPCEPIYMQGFLQGSSDGEPELPWWATGEGVPEGEPAFLEVSEDERA